MMSAEARVGGLGTGWLSFREDGDFGPRMVSCLAERVEHPPVGSLVGIWTSAGDSRSAKILLGPSPSDAAYIEGRSVSRRFPFVEFHNTDTTLPVTVKGRAFAPLLPFDISASSVPACILVWRVRNVARAPVTVSIAVSWGRIVGSQSTLASGSEDMFEASSLPLFAGLTGARLEGPLLRDEPVHDLRTYNTRGSQCLLAALPKPTSDGFVHVWDATAFPAWWSRFIEDGSLPTGSENHKQRLQQPALCVAVRTELAASEEREFAFALAWHNPRLYDTSSRCWKPLYALRFTDAEHVARQALEDRHLKETLSSEWQWPFLRDSGLAPWLTRLCRELETTITRSVLVVPEEASRVQNLFFALRDRTPDTEQWASLAMRLDAQPCLLALYPRLDGLDIARYLETLDESASDMRAAQHLVRLCAENLRRLGRGAWLGPVWPGIKALIEHYTGRPESSALGKPFWRDMLDMATIANDTDYAEECAKRLREANQSAGVAEPESAWREWQHLVGCEWDRQSGVLRILPQSLTDDRSFTGVVFGGQYVASVVSRWDKDSMSVEYRLDRVVTPSESGVEISPGHVTGQQVRAIRLNAPLDVDTKTLRVLIGTLPVGVATVTRQTREILDVELQVEVVLRSGDRLRVLAARDASRSVDATGPGLNL